MWDVGRILVQMSALEKSKMDINGSMSAHSLKFLVQISIVNLNTYPVIRFATQ